MHVISTLINVLRTAYTHLVIIVKTCMIFISTTAALCNSINTNLHKLTHVYITQLLIANPIFFSFMQL